METITAKCEDQNFWQKYDVHFGCLELKWRSCEIPFPKSIVYSDVVLDKLGQGYESFFPR